MNFSYETSFGIPKAQPEYLRAADYMILYNEALRNDGGNPMYSYQDIENARAGVDPVKYPDQNYYSSEFLRGFKPQNRVSAEFIGGSRVAQYYLNAGFYNTKSIVSMGESDKQRTNRFNVRGNVDVNINKYIKVSLDAAAIFNSYHGPNWKNGNFWRLSTENPVNSYPFLIPVDRLDMEDEYTKTALEDAELQRSVIGGKYLVGGNNNNNPNYLRNPYGDLYLGGYANTMDRMAHINVGIDVDFSWLTEGLSFKTYFGTDNYNKYTTTQNNSYASYEPAFGDDGTIRIANIYGSNDFVGSQTMTDTGFSPPSGVEQRAVVRPDLLRPSPAQRRADVDHAPLQGERGHARREIGEFRRPRELRLRRQVRGGVQRRLYRFDLPVARQPLGLRAGRRSGVDRLRGGVPARKPLVELFENQGFVCQYEIRFGHVELHRHGYLRSGCQLQLRRRNRPERSDDAPAG